MTPATDEADLMISTPEGPSSFLTRFFLRGIRVYTYNTPIPKGKYRVYLTALKFIRERPDSLLTTVKDGRQLVVDLTTGMEETVFFIGEYEPAITKIAEKMIAEGDTCIDIGANFGWYTTLMSLRAGRKGSVHAFEPVPKTFAQLERNSAIAQHPERISINNFALGDREDTVEINLFEDQPSGLASLSAKGQTRVSAFECRMTTLDLYLEEKEVENVNFVKADIEGSELMMLNGAETLLAQEVPPIVLMEMALEQTRNFGYIPNDLIEFIRARAEYDFYKVDEIAGKLMPIEGFAPDDIGANVFCIPANAPEKVKGVVKEYLA